LYRKTLAEQCPEIWICKPIRYDSFRQAAKVYREMINDKWKSATGLQSFVLWAGQPETEDGIETLHRLSPSLLKMDIVLLLKTHPRDEGYKKGVYQQKLKEWGIMHKDVTSLTLNECMAFGPKLVLTQFSSLAIEAGFYGLPSIHVLYEDIGSKRLYTKKGFSTPPWCLEGASFLITNTVHQDEVIRTALKNISERNRQLEIFDQYFGVVAEYTPSLADKIRQLPNTERRRNSHLIQDIQPVRRGDYGK
jgi:hypothetical protein